MRELLESSVERLLAEGATPQVRLACDLGAWPQALWTAIAESGFALAAVPESLGGAGATWHDLFGVLLSCGRHGVPAPMPEAMLANWLLGKAGLAPVEDKLSFGLGEGLTLRDGHVSGTLAGVPWGRYVDIVVGIAAAPAPIVVVLAPKDAARMSLRSNAAGEPRDNLQFDGARVLAHAPLPASLDADVLLQGGALLRSAQMAGALEAVLELTLKHAIERTQFGKPIGSFQAIQHQIAVLAENTALARSASESACAAGDFELLALASAKVCAGEAASAAAAIAHAVHGAIGFTHEHTLHLWTRRLWAWRSEFGNSTHWSTLIGRAACANGSRALWPAVTRGSFESAGAAS